MLNKNIVQLVDENFIHARALHYLGIDFMDFADKTLIDVCRRRHLNINVVLKTLDSFAQPENTSRTELESFPVSLIIGYLKHSHHTFIKHRLPYINSLISNLHPDFRDQSDLKDLHLIFPVFLEDFIKHIYEEEDTLFGYISGLAKFTPEKPKSVSEFIVNFQPHSLQEIADEHSEEDEMEGLREMVKCIMNLGLDDIVVKTITREMLAFDQELDNHAKIENEILFPKAIQLEKEVFGTLGEISKLN
ncbi:MAG: iron-sulfur cluster repair di-iron protein [Bacteroidota bacterium]